MNRLPPIHSTGAYANGWRAAQRGEPKTANPFSMRKYKRDWNAGYDAGKGATNG